MFNLSGVGGIVDSAGQKPVHDSRDLPVMRVILRHNTQLKLRQELCIRVVSDLSLEPVRNPDESVSAREWCHIKVVNIENHSTCNSISYVSIGEVLADVWSGSAGFEMVVCGIVATSEIPERGSWRA